MSVAEAPAWTETAAWNAALNAYRTARGELLSEAQSDALIFGARYAFEKGYRQACHDTAAIGEVVPVFRRLADTLEGLEP